jgi:predicted PurR-regulated permease PerM
MAIDLGRENVLLGVCVVLVPAVGPVVSFMKKGPAMRGAVVFVSMLAPGLLLGLMLLVFLPKYSGAGQQAVQTAKWKDLMHQLDSQVRPETPVVTVTVNVASRPGSLTGIQPKCEALLSPFKSYVKGSLKIDADTRTVTYQYRGSENFDTLIAFYLASSTGAFIPQPRIDPAAP